MNITLGIRLDVRAPGTVAPPPIDNGVLSPVLPLAKQGSTIPGSEYVELTWDMPSEATTGFVVKRNGVTVATIGPFVQYKHEMDDAGGALNGVTWANYAYSNATAYTSGQGVRFGGKVYKANTSTTGNAPPHANWTFVHDETWDKCRFKDTAVSGGNSYAYRVYGIESGTTATISSRAVTVSVNSNERFTNVITVADPTGTNDDTKIQTAINAAKALPAGSKVRIQFGTGTYLVGDNPTTSGGFTYAFDYSGLGNVSFRKHASGTTIKTKATYAGAASPTASPQVYLGFGNNALGTTSQLASDIAKGAITATFTAITGFAEGDALVFADSARITGTSAPAARTAGYTSRPGDDLNDIDCWECNEVKTIAGNVVTFKYPFSQKIYASDTSGTPVVAKLTVSEVYWEGINFEGQGTADSTNFYRLMYCNGFRDLRFIDCTSGYSNTHWTEMRTTYDSGYINVTEADHGAGDSTQSQYTLNMNRSANAYVICSTIGTNGTEKVKSPITYQRCPRTVIRHNQIYESKNYSVDEHGAWTRDWYVENNYFQPGIGNQRGACFMGNSSFHGSGRGIIRNNVCVTGPHFVDAMEQSYEVVVVSNQAYGLAKTATSVNGAFVNWYGWDHPDESTVEGYGAARWVVENNAMRGGAGDALIVGWAGSPYWGDGSAGSGPDQAGDGKGYVGTKDWIVRRNHFDCPGAVTFVGQAPRTSRLQVSRNSGTKQYQKPALAAGSYWDLNANAGSYTLPSAYTRDFTLDTATTTSTTGGWGPGWTPLVFETNASPQFAVASSTGFKGRLSAFVSSTGVTEALNLRPDLLADALLQRTFPLSATNPGVKKYGLALRHIGGAWNGDCYFARIINTSSTSATLQLWKRTSVVTATTLVITDTQLGSDVLKTGLSTATNNVTVWRLEALGTTIRTRFWQGTDPGTWDISVTDSAISLPGYVGVYETAPAAQSNSMDTSKFEILSGSSPAQSTFGSATAKTWDIRNFPWATAA